MSSTVPSFSRNSPGTANRQHLRNQDDHSSLNIRITDEDTSIIRQITEGLVTHQTQDRTYFIGIIQSKISEIESEFQRLKHETNLYNENNKEYFALSKIADDLSEQVKNLRDDLEDYNMARMNSFCDVKDLNKEINDLNAHNQQIKLTIDELHREKQRKEERIQQLEYKLTNNKLQDDIFSETKNSELKHFSNQTEISILENRMNKIREQISTNKIKQEALSLIDQIYELELKYEEIINENKTLPITSEHEQLTIQIQNDNQQIISIEKQIIELEERKKILKQYFEQQEYNELKNQEQEINEIFLSYEQYLNDIKTIQKTNLNLIILITETLMKNDSIQLKINLNQYEYEKQKSNDTLIILIEQHRKLKQDYIKLETLDQKLTNEYHELKIIYKKMQDDLELFNNLENLKYNAEKRKQKLINDKINIIKQKQITQIEIQNLQSQLQTSQIQLNNNEIHQQLTTLEKKFQTISQTLFTLDEALISQNIQNEYEQIKHQALELVQAHNRWLIQRLK